MRLLICIILANIQLGFDGMSHWYIHSFCHLLIATILGYMVYEKISFEHCIKKTLAFLTFLYFAISSLHGVFLYTGAMNLENELLNVYSGVLGILFINNIFKNMTKKSDKLGLDYIYILYRKPFCNICMIPTLFFSNHGSCAVYCGGYVYGFQYGGDFKRLTKEQSNKYLKDSNFRRTSCHTLKGKEILRLLNGRQWKMNFNCFTVANMFR